MPDSIARKEAAMADYRNPAGMTDAEKQLNDARLYGVGFLRDGKHVALSEVYLSPDTDERDDRLEGYCDGMANHRRAHDGSASYTLAWCDGKADRVMLDAVTEWKRRAAMPVPA